MSALFDSRIEIQCVRGVSISGYEGGGLGGGGGWGATSRGLYEPLKALFLVEDCFMSVCRFLC